MFTCYVKQKDKIEKVIRDSRLWVISEKTRSHLN